MTPEKLKDVLNSFYPISTAFCERVHKSVTSHTLPGNHLIVQAGTVYEQLNFLEHGFEVAYTYHEEKKHLHSLWSSGQFILSGSLYSSAPATEFIELTEPSHIWCLPLSTLKRLMGELPEAYAVYCSLLNQYHDRCSQYIREFKMLRASERYQRMCATYPRIEQQLSQDHIASYLGITPQSLSRIKRELRRG